MDPMEMKVKVVVEMAALFERLALTMEAAPRLIEALLTSRWRDDSASHFCNLESPPFINGMIKDGQVLDARLDAPRTQVGPGACVAWRSFG